MSAPGRKMSLTQATMLVAGNMIGTGVFLLPVNLAHVGGIAIFGWLIATAGVAALGLAFAKLGELRPQQGGPYAYARDFLGPVKLLGAAQALPAQSDCLLRQRVCQRDRL